jgi:hypothetical protein
MLCYAQYSGIILLCGFVPQYRPLSRSILHVALFAL